MQQDRQNPMKPHLSRSQSESKLTYSKRPFYRSSLFSRTLHSTSKNNYLIQQDTIWPFFWKVQVILEWSSLNRVAFVFLFPFQREITALCVSSPAFGDFLSRIKVEAIPVKDTERLFVLLSVVNSYEAIRQPQQAIFHYQQAGKIRWFSMRLSLVLFNPYRWFYVVM